MEDADLDIRLPLAETARRQIDEGEVVLACEVLDVLRDRGEAAVARMLGARVVLEEPWQLLEEARRVHYRWLVTPARLGSSAGGSYHE